MLGFYRDNLHIYDKAFTPIEIEQNKLYGIKNKNTFQMSDPSFGKQTNALIKVILDELNKDPPANPDKDQRTEYKQLPQWLKEAKVFWDIIDKHTKELTRFDNMDQIHANKIVTDVLKKLWDKDWKKTIVNEETKQEEPITIVIEKLDNEKLQKQEKQLKCQLEKYDKDSAELLLDKLIVEDRDQKLEFMKEFIYEPFDKWLADNADGEGQNVTYEMQETAKKVLRSKMDVNATDFERKLRNCYFKVEMENQRTGGNKPINNKAYELLKDDEYIKATDAEKEKMNEEAFNTVWEK